MTTQNLRNEVLKAFKALHNARKSIFKGDKRALLAGRNKINEEFKKYKHVTDKEAIKELIQLAKDVEKELKSNVIQAVKVAPHKYQVRITADTTKLENIPYNDCSKAQ